LFSFTRGSQFAVEESGGAKVGANYRADQRRVDWICFLTMGSVQQPNAFHDPTVSILPNASHDACGGVERNTGILPLIVERG